MLVDTHCHLNFDAFDDDREAVIVRALDAGVGRMLNPGINVATNRQALELAGRYAEVYVAVGVHPNDALSWNETTLDELKRMARHPKNVAIGEIGLDYYWNDAPRDVQQYVFRQQLDLAAQLGLPIVVHTRDGGQEKGKAVEIVRERTATQDVLEILATWKANLEMQSSPLVQRPGVLHSFSGDVETAQRAISLGFQLGITGPVTFKKADLLRQVVAEMPLECLLVETDAPFLTPHPHRGERNEPGYARFVAEKIAQVRGVSIETVMEITTANAQKLFLW